MRSALRDPLYSFDPPAPGRRGAVRRMKGDASRKSEDATGEAQAAIAEHTSFGWELARE